jgi:hypothetical protein
MIGWDKALASAVHKPLDQRPRRANVGDPHFPQAVSGGRSLKASLWRDE